MSGGAPFIRELGTRQGRVQSPAGIVPPEGTHVFILGYDLPRHTEIFNISDYVEISQTATFTAGTKLLRVRVKLRSPLMMPAGLLWCFSLVVDGVERTRRLTRNGAVQNFFDLAANVANLGGGAHSVALRLQLVTG